MNNGRKCNEVKVTAGSPRWPTEEPLRWGTFIRLMWSEDDAFADLKRWVCPGREEEAGTWHPSRRWGEGRAERCSHQRGGMPGGQGAS